MERLFGKRALLRVLDRAAELISTRLLLARARQSRNFRPRAHVVYFLGCVVSERPLVADTVEKVVLQRRSKILRPLGAVFA
jgi:hypothetical protein